jgi:hypothetical protein
MSSQKIVSVAALIFFLASLSACQNSIPTVTLLSSVPGTSIVPAKDSHNFAQLNAASNKETLAGGYKGNLRISQPLAELNATDADGYKLKATVHLSR